MSGCEYDLTPTSPDSGLITLQHELALLRDHISAAQSKGAAAPLQPGESRIGLDGKMVGRSGANKYLEISIDGGKVGAPPPRTTCPLCRELRVQGFEL